MKRKFFILLFVLNIIPFIGINFVNAKCVGGSACDGKSENLCVSPCDWFADAVTKKEVKSGTTCLVDPLTGYNPCTDSSNKAPNMNTMIGTVIKSVLGIVGSLALAMFVYGGFVMMLSAGNMEKVQKGRGILIWASVGLVVIFSAYAMVKFVIEGISGT